MICTHENYETVLETKGYKLQKCLSCYIIFAKNDKNDTLDRVQVYENYYKKKKANRFGFLLELLVRMFRFLRASKIFFSAPRSKSILDIGSGRGYTLYYLKKYFGFKKTVGTQISENAYQYSKQELGLEIYNRDLLDISFQNSFSIITIY